MKLDVAVDLAVVELIVVSKPDAVDGKGRSRAICGGLTGFVVALVALLASSAMALDGIDLSQPGEPSVEGECPRLIQIKYPFLTCLSGEIGQTDADDTWDDLRRIPIGSKFVEGNGYFGWDLNTD